jgi:hypothetical protein
VAPRLDLQALLESLLGSGNVYFQPPPTVAMNYPAIVYNRDFRKVNYADNSVYTNTLRYQVMLIAADPDSPVLDKLGDLPLSTYVRHYTADHLNHDVFDVYF